MPLEYKSVPFEVKAADRNAEDTGWEIAGLASTWWGEPDAYGDVVQPGAFAASLASRPTKFLYEHHTPIGKQLEISETDEGLYGRWSVDDTVVGTDAYKLAKAGVLDSLSIGYIPLEWEIRGDGVRVLQKCDLYEVSAVALPANENAVITAVKRAPAAEPEPDADGGCADSRGASSPEPLPSISFDLDDVRRCLVALGAIDREEIAS